MRLTSARRVWFTSDLHLGDEWPAKMRYGKQNVTHHDDWLADTWDERVGDDDDVWVLGDVTVGWPLDDVVMWLACRPGRKHLVRGNWDQGYSLKHWRQMGFQTAHDPGVVLDEDGCTMQLVHAPGEASRSDVHAVLHGHTHRKQQKAWRDGKNRLMIHVGFDAWRAPVPFNEIRILIEENMMSTWGAT